MKKWIKKIMMISSVLIFAGCAGTPPGNIGVSQERLADCPNRPNCVSSQTDDPDKKVAPLAYVTDQKTAMAALVNVLEKWEETAIIQTSDNYVYAECRSRVFGFVDDVEFFFPQDSPLIHVRSASRLGYSDLGVNAERIQKIRSAFRSELNR